MKKAETVKFLMRLPRDMRVWLAKAAAENGRSANAEILDRLEKSKAGQDTLQQLQKTAGELSDRVTLLEQARRP